MELTSPLLDEFRIRSDTYQYRLDTNQLRWLPSHDPFLHHMQCVCSCRVLLPFLIANSVLLERVVQRIVSFQSDEVFSMC